MPLIAIYNPVSGSGTAKDLFDNHVIPLLQKSGRVVDKCVATESPDHAGRILVEFLQENSGKVTVVLGSGDGTLHDIVNFMSKTEMKGVRAGLPPSHLYFVLVPCGTANALYSSLFPVSEYSADDISYKLKSVQSFIDGGRTVPLTLAITTLSSPPAEKKRPSASAAAVVVSTCLHASILHDSEALRKEIPGMERFKVAAKNNSNRWYNASAKLLPTASKNYVELFDPISKTFIPHPDADEGDPIVDLYGPFAYFLSTVNVDRLEPAFKITPLMTEIPPAEASMDVVIVRPLRDPSTSWDNPEAREAFVPKLYAILSTAYRNGEHVNLLYNESGEIITGGEGPMAVEYIRCGGWEWLPDSSDEAAHLLCTDGAISVIEKEGRAVCSAATPDSTAGFIVYG